MLVNIKGTFWYVMDGLRRGFSNYDAFLNLGFEPCMSANSDINTINAIPSGTPFTDNSTLHKQEIRERSFLPTYLNESSCEHEHVRNKINERNHEVWSKYKGNLISYHDFMNIAGDY